MPRRHNPHSQDIRATLYHMAKQAAAIILVIVLVKLVVFDLVAIRGEQMAPGIRDGDRLLVLRLPYLPGLRVLPGPGRNQPVVFRLPFDKRFGCLRVAGVSGDSVFVQEGVFRNGNAPGLVLPYPQAGKVRSVMPQSFSPRDFIDPFLVPGPGSVITVDSLDPYEFCFASAVIRQENPLAGFEVKPRLFINDTLCSDYFIADFVLYRGALDSVPDSSRYDWFFWKRLADYLSLTESGKTTTLSLSLVRDGSRIEKYRVRERHLFLLADNWEKGLDSRYFGPVLESHVFGRPFLVLWSYLSSRAGGEGLRIKRFGRILW